MKKTLLLVMVLLSLSTSTGCPSYDKTEDSKSNDKYCETTKENATSLSTIRTDVSERDITEMVETTTPTLTLPISLEKISAGWKFGMQLKNDGSVWTWGSNFFGELGNGECKQDFNKFGEELPGSKVPLNIISGDVSSIEAGGQQAFAIKSDGSLWAWGYNGMGQTGIGNEVLYTKPTQIFTSGVVAVSSGSAHSVALMADGSVWTWGLNNWGQLGDGTMTSRSTPQKVIEGGVVAVCAGSFCTFVIKSDGSLWAWGCNSFGELGDGSTEEVHTPKQIISSGVIAVSSSGGDFGCRTVAIKSDGSLWSWGSEHTDLAGGTPKQLVSGDVISAVVAWRDNVYSDGPVILAIKSDGSLWGWAFDFDSNEAYEPYQIFTDGVVEVSAGCKFYLALKEDGSLYTWGVNAQGQLGDGTSEDNEVPTLVS